ncbi:MAG TPA: hypothetical protein VHP31_12200 [Caproicibacter sp.]|nr:hypothetical protein [Caproicibacter sp.]
MQRKKKSNKEIDRQTSIINLIVALVNLLITLILLYEKFKS